MLVFHRWQLVALALTGMTLPCAAQEATSRFTIRISTKQSTAQTGSEIKVKRIAQEHLGSPYLGVRGQGRRRRNGRLFDRSSR
jgi:hypothetical protein